MKVEGEHLVCRIIDVDALADGVYAIRYVEQEKSINRKTLFLRTMSSGDKRLSQVDVLSYKGCLVDIVMREGKIVDIQELKE
jgi:ribosomal protein S1